MVKFLITNDVNKTYDKIFKIVDKFYGASAKKCSDSEQQLHNGFMVGFNNLPEQVLSEIESLKHVEVIKGEV